ncbi:MAG: hypothetical protein KDK70_33135, partial [Myxococcales bacterium]|nr:hypothetical protein [Myxococcales bacterium]
MTELETLHPVLDAIPAAEVLAPDLPMSVLLQEAHDLHVALQDADTRARLAAVGLAPAQLAALPVGIAAARQAQSRWILARERTKPGAQLEREAAGAALRAELVAACRWNLRQQPRAQRVLDRIAARRDLAGLAQDLRDLAALLHHHRAHFELDQTLDASARAEAARSLAAQLAAGL